MKKFKDSAAENSIDWPVLLGECVEASSTGVTISDARALDFPLIYVNEAFVRMTGYARDEVLGSNCRFLQGGDRLQPEIRTLRESMLKGVSCRQVLRNYRKNGALFWNALQVSPVRDSDGRLTHYIGIQTDVTDQIQMAAAQAQMEKAAQMQAYEIAIAQSSHLANLGEMASFIVHEINNPLSVLTAKIELLMEQTVRPHFQVNSLEPALDILKNNVLRIASVVQKVKCLAHHGPATEHIQVRIADMISHATQLWELRLARAGVSFLLPSGGDTVSFKGDLDLVAQIISNLIGNAFHAVTGTDSPWIKIDVHVTAIGIEVRVKNSGPDIPIQIREKLFSEYVSTKPRGVGTGFGLMICKKIAESHNGSIELEAYAGHTSFLLKLPLAG